MNKLDQIISDMNEGKDLTILEILKLMKSYNVIEIGREGMIDDTKPPMIYTQDKESGEWTSAPMDYKKNLAMNNEHKSWNELYKPLVDKMNEKEGKI